MMDEKRLEQKYREIKRQAAPDLWNRIEEGLKVHPERQMAADKEPEEPPAERFKIIKKNRSRIYGMAAAAAAMLAVMIVYPKISGEKAAATEGVNWNSGQETAEAGPSMLAAGAPETAEPMDRAFPESKQSEAAPGMGNGVTENQAAADRKGEDEKSRAGSLSGGKSRLKDGVVHYGQLKAAVYQPVTIPQNAVTIPEDAQYFSEAVLRDAQLLCSGTVQSVSFEEDSSGKAVKVVYELILKQVYYAEDYITDMDRIVVKSPIIKTEGDEMYVLYQLQPEGTYLLPLCRNDGDWELLYPFAPQIQVTGDGEYLFHSGYASLVNDSASLVIGSQEGRNDYYYDRMVLRKDEEFLSDLLALVEH